MNESDSNSGKDDYKKHSYRPTLGRKPDASTCSCVWRCQNLQKLRLHWSFCTAISFILISLGYKCISWYSYESERLSIPGLPLIFSPILITDQNGSHVSKLCKQSSLYQTPTFWLGIWNLGMHKAYGASWPAPGKNPGPWALISFPGGQHIPVLSQSLARGIKHVLCHSAWERTLGNSGLVPSFPPDSTLN